MENYLCVFSIETHLQLPGSLLLAIMSKFFKASSICVSDSNDDSFDQGLSPQQIPTGNLDGQEYSPVPPPAETKNYKVSKNDLARLRDVHRSHYISGGIVVPGLAQAFKIERKRTIDGARSALSKYARFCSMVETQIRATKALAMRDLVAHVAFLESEKKMKRQMLVQLREIHRKFNSIDLSLKVAAILHSLRKELDTILFLEKNPSAYEPFPLPDNSFFRNDGDWEQSVAWELDDSKPFVDDTLQTPMDLFPGIEPHSDEKTTRKEDWVKRKRKEIEANERRKLFTALPFPNERPPKPKEKKKHKILDPHYDSLDLINLDGVKHMFDLLDKTLYPSLDESVVSMVENLVLLLGALIEAVSVTQITNIVLLYVKTHFKESLAVTAFEFIRSFLFPVEPQGDNDVPDWLGGLRSHLGNWKLFTTHPVFKKFSYLCSCMITLGLCDKSSFDWNVAGVQIFSVNAVEKQVGAFDLLGAIVETLIFFVEGGYACFTTGSIKPLLYSDHRMREFDRDYNLIVANIDNVQTGNLHRSAGMDENEFAHKLEVTLRSAQELVDVAQGSWERKVFSDKLARLRNIESTFNLVRVQGGLRVAPYCVCFFGGSGVGKSSISALTMVVGLSSNGYRASDDVLITMNEADKYMSNMRSSVNGMFLDDVNNTRAAFVEKAPTTKFIEVVNNVRQYANMAEAQHKGKVSIEPRWVNVTTNTKDFGANVYSNEPVSVVRRANVTVTVTVKQKFCTRSFAGAHGMMLDPQKVAEFYTNPETGVVEIPMLPDIWDLKVERVLEVKSQAPGGVSSIGYETVIHNGCPLDCVGIETFLEYVLEDSAKHFVNQQSLIERSNNLVAKFVFCPECKKPDQLCKCAVEPHGASGNYMVGVVAGVVTSNLRDRFLNACTKVWQKEEKNWENWATRKIVQLSLDIEDSWFVKWTNWIPNDWLLHPWGKTAVLFALREEVGTQIRAAYVRSIFCCCFLAIVSTILGCSLLSLPIILYILYRLLVRVRVVREELFRQIVDRNDSIPEIAKRARDSTMKFVLGALGGAAVLYSICLMYRGFRKSKFFPQGNLTPCCAEDIEKRDAEESPWRGLAPVAEIPCSQSHRTIVPSDLANLAFKNLCFMQIRRPTVVNSCDAFFPCSNVAIIPHHMWFRGSDTPDETMDVTFTHANGHNFRCNLGYDHSVLIPNTDLSVVWVPAGGEWRDVRKFLPLEKCPDGPVLVPYRGKDGTRLDCTAYAKFGAVGHNRSAFMGVDLVYNTPTFKGMCMAPIISNTKNAMISGFHLGGETGKFVGVGGVITQNQFEQALLDLSQCPGVLLAHSMGNMQSEQYGKRVLSSRTVHPKCPLNFMPDGPVVAFGSVEERSAGFSKVVELPISAAVEEVYGVERKHGPPKINPTWRVFHENLTHVQKPSPGIPAYLLDLAVEDYLKSVLPVLRNPGSRKYLRVLNNDECLSGIDGVRFIDSLVLSTSAGFPFGGPKEQFFERLPPNDTHQSPLNLDDKFWEMVLYCENEYVDGRRCYHIFKSCLKDEPTKLTSTKVRVFQGAPLHLSILIRKYFLPVARVLSLNPLISECAVGINCQGPEWQQLVDHVKTFGTTRILAGDYSKYDLRMPAQLILAAFKILISIAENSGRYNSRDLVIMRGIATDVAYSVTSYDGTLVQMLGSNPSGHNLTVYVNSIVNSLLFRAAYYDLDPFPIHFQDVCKLSTYGDDAWCGVSEKCHNLDHLSFATFLAKYDMVFTMPDKTSEPTAFMQFDDVDFLKRRSCFHPKIGIEFGALDEGSIFKSLHSVVRSKAISLSEQSVANMEGALREWFFHGENVYEDRRLKMVELAKKVQLPVRGMHDSYDDRARQWCVDYNWPVSETLGCEL